MVKLNFRAPALQDVSQDTLAVKIKLVDRDYVVHRRILELSRCNGKKACLLLLQSCPSVVSVSCQTSLQKADHIQMALERFCPDEGDRSAFAKTFKEPGSGFHSDCSEMPVQCAAGLHSRRGASGRISGPLCGCRGLGCFESLGATASWFFLRGPRHHAFLVYDDEMLYAQRPEIP